MQLLVVTQYFWPENFRVNELVLDLCKRGHQVTVLTGLPNYPEGRVFSEYRMNPSSFSDFNGAKIVRVPVLGRGRTRLTLFLNYLSFAVSASFLGAWRLRSYKCDAVFVYEPSPISVGVPAAFLRKIKRVPVALWVLDLWPDTLKAVGIVKSEWILSLVGLLVRWVYDRSDLILAQSKSFIVHIKRYSSNAARVEYFPAWVDDVFLVERNCPPAPEVAEAPGVFTVLFAGNLGEAQDFPAILDAAEILSLRVDIRWVLVGDGRMGEWIAQEIKARNLTNKLIMVGRHELDRMPAFFAHADALLVSLKKNPIFEMTIPGKLQAYLGSGLPIVAMLDGEGADLIRESGAGLVSPSGEANLLAANVERLAAMSVRERAVMGKKGQSFSKSQFDREMLVGRLEGWLNTLLVSKQFKGRSD